MNSSHCFEDTLKWRRRGRSSFTCQNVVASSTGHIEFGIGFLTSSPTALPQPRQAPRQATNIELTLLQNGKRVNITLLPLVLSAPLTATSAGASSSASWSSASSPSPRGSSVPKARTKRTSPSNHRPIHPRILIRLYSVWRSTIILSAASCWLMWGTYCKRPDRRGVGLTGWTAITFLAQWHPLISPQRKDLRPEFNQGPAAGNSFL